MQVLVQGHDVAESPQGVKDQGVKEKKIGSSKSRLKAIKHWALMLPFLAVSLVSSAIFGYDDDSEE
jgi:hypothetical protein